MALFSSRSSGISRTAIAALLAGLMVFALAPIGDAQQAPSLFTCAPLDGSREPNGWRDGIVAPGIHVGFFAKQGVVLTVQEGFTLVDMCVATKSGVDVYNTNAELPVVGEKHVWLKPASAAHEIVQVSFDTQADEPEEVTCPTVSPPNVAFSSPRYIDRDRAGGEPVSVVAQDGSISVSAHAGTTHVYKDPSAAPGAGDFATGYFNQTLNWRSTDGGDSWEYVGIAGQNAGPHSAASTGFSDPDFAMDQGGNLYNVEIDLANVSVFKSNDDGQSYLQANPEAAFGDRPWLTALEEDEVFLYVNLPRRCSKSVDGGLTWIPVESTPQGFVNGGSGPRSPISSIIRSKAIPDPLNPDNGLIGPDRKDVNNPGSNFAFGIENDANVDNPGPHDHLAGTGFGDDFGPSTQFFGTVAADSPGNVYQAAAGGLQRWQRPHANGRVTSRLLRASEGPEGSPGSAIPPTKPSWNPDPGRRCALAVGHRRRRRPRRGRVVPEPCRQSRRVLRLRRRDAQRARHDSHVLGRVIEVHRPTIHCVERVPSARSSRATSASRGRTATRIPASKQEIVVWVTSSR